MIILGVDPGLRHTGWCVTDDDKPLGRGTIVPPGRGHIQPHEVLNVVLPILAGVIDMYNPSVAVVEQVAYYGTARRITLPLSHVAGAITGYCLGRGIPTYLLLAMMKKGKAPTWRSEHERDSYVLATVIRKHELAVAAGDPSARPERSAVARRRITAVKNAP